LEVEEQTEENAQTDHLVERIRDTGEQESLHGVHVTRDTRQHVSESPPFEEPE
jgi:hypothetical protein